MRGRCWWRVAVLAAAAGCTSAQSLAGQYKLVPSETQRIALVHARAFFESGTLDQVPPGKIHWIREPTDILKFIGSMEGDEAHEGLRVIENEGDKEHQVQIGGHRALVVLFFPEDAFSRRAIELDEHLDILAGYRQHGTTVLKPAFHTTIEFKQRVLEVLGRCAVCREYLGIQSDTGGHAAPADVP